MRLSLTDDRWAALETRNGSASWVPAWLGRLAEVPAERLGEFGVGWPALCSEGTAWSAAFAATPYIADLVAAAPTEARCEYVFFLGLVSRCTIRDEPGGSFGIRDYLAAAHRDALARALPLAVEVLRIALSAEDTRQLLADVAALKGYAVLGDCISRLHCGHVCQRCGAEVDGSAYIGETE